MIFPATTTAEVIVVLHTQLTKECGRQMRIRLTVIDNDQCSSIASRSTLSRCKERRMNEAEPNRGTREAPRLCNRPRQFCPREPYGTCICMEAHHFSPRTMCFSQTCSTFANVRLRETLIQEDIRILL